MEDICREIRAVIARLDSDKKVHISDFPYQVEMAAGPGFVGIKFCPEW